MFNQRHYVPILKSKQGEFKALAKLEDSDRELITPLLDLVRVPPDWKKGGPSKELGAHLEDRAKKFAKSWSDRPAFVDLYDISLDARVGTAVHPVTHAFAALRDAGAQAIPSIGLDRDADYSRAVASVVAKDKRGVCVRLLGEDLLSPAELWQHLTGLVKRLRVPLEQVHIILDFRAIRIRDLGMCSKLAVGVLQGLGGLTRLASLTVAASSMPQSLGEKVNAGKTGMLPRLELRLWRSILGAEGLVRRPSFGDYGIVHPDFLDFDPRKITPAAGVRYTTGNGWLVLRGRSLKKWGYPQFHDLAAGLVRRSDFLGEDWSWGDRYIQQSAARRVGTGNLSTWVGVGTNHHLAVVARQVSQVN